MPDAAQDYWNWRNNLPPIATIFPQLGAPSVAPMTEVGVPGSTPNLVRPYTPPKTNPLTGPGLAPNITAPGVTGVTFPSGMPLADFTNPTPTAASGQPASTADDEYKKNAFEALLKNKDFGGALAMLVKGMGGGKSTATSSPFRVSAANMGGPKRSVEGPAGQLLGKAMATLEESDLRVPIKRKGGGAQSRYDILARRQNQDLSELFKNLV